jgi:hypothetical protein
MEMPEKYDRPKYEKFRKDCENAGFDVWHYRGRFFYEGPAVTVGDMQDVIRATTVKVQWDNMARDYVVYPKD